MTAGGGRSARPTFRERATYVALALATIAVGLLVHLRGSIFGPVTRDMLGDALWAAMIAWWIGALIPRARLAARGAGAFAICAAVEVSQRFDAPALNALRETWMGQVVLGSGFDPRDFLAYALGVAGAVLLETAVRPASSRASTRAPL